MPFPYPNCPSCQQPEDRQPTCRHCGYVHPPASLRRGLQTALMLPVGVVLALTTLLVAVIFMVDVMRPVGLLPRVTSEPSGAPARGSHLWARPRSLS
jgi:hypothetical protein